MKTNLLQNKQLRRGWASLVGLSVAVSSVSAATETNSPPDTAANPPQSAPAEPAPAQPAPAKEEAVKEDAPKSEEAAKSEEPKTEEKSTEAEPLTPEQMFEGGTEAYSNWVDFSTGGFFTSGNKAEAQQYHQTAGGAFGGIDDFHYQKDLTNGTSVVMNGHSIFGQNDYKLSLDVKKEKLGYLRFNFSEFRTWSNGDGGFFRPSGTYYPLSDSALALDRGEFSIEGGLTLENKPQVTFKYAHGYREGEKASTIWGITHPVGGNLTRGLSPSFYDIDERSDSFQLDVTHKIKKTDVGAGLRYETGKLDDALKITQAPGEPLQQKITDRQGVSYDLLNLHTFTETWLKTNLLFSSGFSFSDLDNEFSGSRIYGSDFDIGYVPNAQNGFGYLGLNGGSRLYEYVLNLNLLYRPTPNLTLVPSVRVQKEDWTADSTGLETFQDSPASPFNANSDRGLIDVRERLDLRYTGVTNWVLYARGELTEGEGNLKENGGLVPINGFGVSPIQRETEDSRFFQKYSAGARWYPTRRVAVDFGGYYKLNSYDYDHLFDSTPNFATSPNRYPAFLTMQKFATYDGNTRLTLRPLQNLTLVSRYEYQFSTINTQPDPISGLSEVESSTMTSHILGQDISWSPFSRLYLQAGFNYVFSETKTPASELTEAILNSQNNYWALNFTSGFALDNKTDLKLSYFYYKANNYEDNSFFGVPYGADADEHSITATLARQISKNLRWTLKYGYSRYADVTFGGNRSFDAHFIYTGLRYRF